MLLKCLCLLCLFCFCVWLAYHPQTGLRFLRVWSACFWYLDHHLDVFCTISRADSVLEFVILASIDSHRGPICFTSLTELLPSLASAWSRYVCTVGGCLAPALTASAFDLSRRLLGLRQFPATPMPTWGHHL